MIDARGIEAGYGAFLALRGIDFEARRGEVVGLCGPNGSGKTTLVRLCCGVISARSGTLKLHGRDVGQIARRELARMVALVPQAPSADLPFTVLELVLMGRAPHLGVFGLESARDLDAARAAMEQADVAGLADRLVSELSGGERQRAFIAKALAQTAELLLLDEPTAHLDVGHQMSVCALARRLAAQGSTVVMVLHDLNLAALACDRVLLLQDGRAAGFGPPRQVLTPERVEAVFGARLYAGTNPETGAPFLVPASLELQPDARRK